MTTNNVRTIREAAPLNIPVPGPGTSYSALLGGTHRAGDKFAFAATTWDLREVGGLAATARCTKVLDFKQVPERYRDLVKLAVVARVSPERAAEITGANETAIKRAFGRSTSNLTTAAGDFQQMVQVLKRVDGLNATEVPQGGWRPVLNALKTGTDGTPLGDRTVRNYITTLKRLDTLFRSFTKSSTGLFGSEPFDGKTQWELVPKTAEEKHGGNAVKPNPQVFEMLGFSAWMIDNLADDICAGVEHFQTRNPNRKSRHNPDTLPPLSFGWHDGDYRGQDSYEWAHRLLAACFNEVAVSYALRPRDIANLDRECVITRDGRQLVRGWRSKGLKQPVETTFPAIPQAVKAIEVMNRLLDAYHVDAPVIEGLPKKRHRLFTHLTGQGDGTVVWDHLMSGRLKDAARHCEARGLIDGNLDHIGHVTMQEMRVTALAHYADRPMGVALAAHFSKHGGKAVLGGYISTVHSKLVAPDVGEKATADEIAALRRAAQAAHLTHALRVDHRAADGKSEGLTGYGLNTLDRKLADPDLDGAFVELVNDPVRLENPRPLTPEQVALVADNNRNVEVGPLTLCLFEPGNALCGGKGSADFRMCRPNACHNSVMTPGHRALMELRRRVAVESGDAFLKVRDLDPIAEDFAPGDGYPGLEAEFADLSDDDLIDLYHQEADDLMRLIIDGPEEDTNA